MKSLLSFFLISLLTFPCACTSTVPSPKHEKDKYNFKKAAFFEIQGDALETIWVLNAFREGRPENSIELLEFEVDNKVSLLWSNLGNMEEATRNSSLKILHKIKDYRKNHPRVINVTAGDNNLLEMTNKAKEEAENILENL